MKIRRASILLTLCSLGLACSCPVWAQQVYRWVDENGVVTFSDTAPAAASGEVDALTLEDSAPKDYDPEQDIYHVAAQAERMQALRDEMAKEREARREQQQRGPQQPAVEAQRGVNYGYPYQYPAYGRPPYRPDRPPARPPERPTPEPDDTSTLRPLRPIPDPRGG